MLKGNLLFNIAKNSFFLQNRFISFLSSIHPSIEHNVGKSELIKKAMFHCEIEEIKGDYFEFGMFEGASLYSAVTNHKKIKSEIKRQFYGFDSFEGFKYFTKEDNHPFFKENEFKSSYEKVLKRFKKYPNVNIIPGYFEKSLKTKKMLQIRKTSKCAIVFIDCDLSSPAFISLEYIAPLLQKGSVIILDDYWAYKGDTTLGSCGAMNKFLKKHTNIKVRPYYNYGHGGTSFIVYDI